jgi:hypothetical protein
MPNPQPRSGSRIETVHPDFAGLLRSSVPFYLAWCSAWGDDPMKNLQYLLVSSELGRFVGLHPFAMISEQGRYLGRTYLSRYQICALRGAETPAEEVSPTEQVLVERLQVRARAHSHPLPPLAPTPSKPIWAAWNPPRVFFHNLTRAFGA